VSSFSLGLRRDTRNWDNIFLPPADGTLSRLSVECAGGPFGGDKDFAKYQISNGWYFKHFKKLFLEVKLRGSLVEEFGDSIDVPVYERFYAGGAYTIRGYKDRDIGPKDLETDDPIGGKAEFIANLEYSYPFTRQMRAAIFYDTGYVWTDIKDVDFADLKSSVGAGIRMNLPIPVRIDYGYGLDHKEGEKKGRFHISIGGWF